MDNPSFTDLTASPADPRFSAAGFRADPGAALRLLAECPAYHQTPLHELASLAVEADWSGLMVKDETQRMGLGSFKALGGAYAVAQLVAEAVENKTGRVPAPSELIGDETRRIASSMVFVCASAGNHGLAVAAGADVFGARAIVYLDDTVPEYFAERLRSKGTGVVRGGSVYEQSMEAARRNADSNGWLLVSDSSWPGYTGVPALVMEGYTVMAEEVRAACEASSVWPTHVALQAGVGGMAAAVAAHIRGHWPVQPEIVVVEPDRAACLQASMEAREPTRVQGPISNMSRLDCKDVSLLAFESLKHTADRFITVTDKAAQLAVDRFSTHGLQTTPSGAAGLAGLKALDLPATAQPLVFITEGIE
ncbi:diaminopropionate ammonia-lyase [Salinisphaera sp. SWV1]|uniref:diaminopropionate ammonia-lyase n=1 Tax=Salinisphaera sp. SWV1 TaxID=3454139 RepID=UPI003F85A708